MSGAIFALVACFLATIGARDQMLLAALTVRQGWRTSLVVTAVLTGALASAIAAAIGLEAGSEFKDHILRLVIAAIGLALAGGESLLRRPRRIPDEPTSSLFAAMLVLLADQVTDPARFIVLAFAISTEEPIAAALGGIVGSGAALVLGAFLAESLLKRQNMLIAARRFAGALLLFASVSLFLWIFMVVARS